MSILAFLAVFSLTIVLQQWLHRHIQGVAVALTGNPGCGLRLLFYVLLPGVLLHEASHYVIARILFVPTSGMRIGVAPLRKENISLGSVNIARTDPVRESLIGVAPFLFGIGAIWLLAGFGFGIWPNSILPVGEAMERVLEYINDWLTWLDLYLIFAVSTAMIPSDSDREPWGPVVTVLGLAVAILFLMGWTPRVPGDWVILARQLVDGLTFALGIAVFVNGAIAGVVWVLERTLMQMSGKRILYKMRRR